MHPTETRQQKYFRTRQQRWDAISGKIREKGRRPGSFYHELLRRQYRRRVPPGLAVLELGCGHGDLLNALSPERGVGVDFSRDMIGRARHQHPHLTFICANVHHLPLTGRFDVIILSDLVNDLWDVQAVLTETAALCHAGTRIIINFFNNMWHLPVRLARRCGWTVDFLEQNWLAPADLANLLRLSGYMPLGMEPEILCPLACPLVEPAANRFLVKIPPFQWLALTNFMIARPEPPQEPPRAADALVSIVIPARNEAGNIEAVLRQTEIPGFRTELIFVEGGSNDGTWDAICAGLDRFPEKNARLLKQSGRGKADAVRAGFAAAAGEVLIILDADLSVSPADLPRFVAALVSGKGEFINGVRLVYPREDRSMGFINMVGNKIFSLAISWLLGQPVKDTLCGTKALWKKDYEIMAPRIKDLAAADPFGDFQLLFMAALGHRQIVDLPVRYRQRDYGVTNIKRWRHGWLLLKMTLLAAARIKFR